MHLFQSGDFKLHAGGKSSWKIDCDALTDRDWETLALMLAERLPPFGTVLGIPRGGLQLAKYMREHITGGSDVTLVVDDVCTTGKSFREFAKQYGIWNQRLHGAVVFCRNRSALPVWVTPLFTM